MVIHVPKTPQQHLFYETIDNEDHVRHGYTLQDLENLFVCLKFGKINIGKSFGGFERLAWDIGDTKNARTEALLMRIAGMDINTINEDHYGWIIVATKSGKSMSEEEYQGMLKSFDEGYYESGKRGYGPHWNDVYDSEHWKWSTQAKWIMDQFHPTSVLDLGCSFGWIVRELTKHGVPSQGLEVSEYAVKKGQEKGAPVIQGDVRNLPFHDGEFDCITGFDVLEHIPLNFIDKTIEGIARVCGRYAIFNIPSEFGTDETHLNIQDKGYWIEKFSKYFQVHNEGSIYWLVKKGVEFPKVNFKPYWPVEGVEMKMVSMEELDNRFGVKK